MDDPQIDGTIESLVVDEHLVRERESAGNANRADRRRRPQVLMVSLDCGRELLRQGRSLPETGRDPKAADLRHTVVEG
jgi:hypothetical protein